MQQQDWMIMIFIEKYKDNPEAEPVIKIANQALENFSTSPKKQIK